MRGKFYHVQIDWYSKDSFLNSIINDLKENNTKSLVFINAHCFNVSYKNIVYRNAISDSDYILNDGIGIKIAGIINRTKFVENLNGTDLIPQIIELAYNNQQKI